MTQQVSAFEIQLPPAVVQSLRPLLGSGLVLLLAAGISYWQQRRRMLAPEPQFDELRFSQPSFSQPSFSQPLQWLGYGKQLERLGRYQDAVALYDRALQQHPQSYRLWHERGLALAKLQRFEAALASYDRAYELCPQQRDLAHERGDTLLQLGRYAEAVESFDIFLQFAPHSGHVLADRGYALMQLGDYKAALRSIEQALSQRWEPGVQIQARHYQIEALRRSGQLQAALRAAQIAMRQHPQANFEAQYAALRQLEQVS